MTNNTLLDSDVALGILILGGSVLGALISAFIVYYLGIRKRDKHGVNSFFSKLDLELPVLLVSLINLDIQHTEHEKAVEQLKHSRTKFDPIERNSFEHLKIEWDIPDYLFQHNEKLAHYIHAFSASLKVVSQTMRRTCRQTKEVKTKLENKSIDTTQAITLYEQMLNRDKIFIPATRQTHPTPVSYTHLTLPTNREV